MNENTDNNDWKTDTPSLAARTRKNPFAVPDGYFESANEAVFSAIFLDSLKQKTDRTGFKFPQDYFESLTERVETGIKLASIAKADSFTVPENYFETLQNRINSRIKPADTKKNTKIIPLWKKDIFKYASVACFILLTSFGIYFYKTNPSIPAPESLASELDKQQILYDIDESTIIEHIEAQHHPISKTTSASDTEMENYILRNFSSNDLAQELYN